MLSSVKTVGIVCAVGPYTCIGNKTEHSLQLKRQVVCDSVFLSSATQGIFSPQSWSTRATQLLFQMTKEKPLVALITSVTNNCMSVCLCDTTTDRDIHINDSLVSQGLALFMPDSQEDREGFDSYQLEGAPVEVRPGP